MDVNHPTVLPDGGEPYDGLAQLRAELTADDPDRRAPAYGAVMEAGLKPSQVLGQQPPEAQLVGAGVIPESASESSRPARAVREETLEVLKDIRDAVQGGGS